MGLDAAILELNAAVDDALWVDHDLDVGGLHVEQPAGFNDLEPLVHQGCGVNRDLGAHVPIRVSEGLRFGDAFEARRGHGHGTVREAVRMSFSMGL